MAYNSKKNIVNIITEIIIFFAYIFYVRSKYSPPVENLKSWAIVMIASIGIGWILLIIVQIIFHIISTIQISINGKAIDKNRVERTLSSSMFVDERDKFIHLKANKISNTFLVSGFVLSIVLLLAEPSIYCVFQFLLGVFWFSAIVEAGANIYLYETGGCNG